MGRSLPRRTIKTCFRRRTGIPASATLALLRAGSATIDASAAPATERRRCADASVPACGLMSALQRRHSPSLLLPTSGGSVETERLTQSVMNLGVGSQACTLLHR